MSEVTATPMFGSAEPRSHRMQMRRVAGRLALVATDQVAMGVALLLAYVGLRMVSTELPGEAVPVLVWVISLTVMIVGLAYGLYCPAGTDPLDRFRRRVMMSLWVPWPALGSLAFAGPASADVILLIAASCVLFLPLSMLLDATVTPMLLARRAWGTDVVVIGSNEDVARITKDLLAQPLIGLRPVGYIGDGSQGSAGMAVPCLGALADLPNLGHVAEAAVVLPSAALSGLDLSALPFGRIVVVPPFGELPLVSVQTRALGRIAGFDFASPSRARTGQFAKRALDLAIAVPALLLAAPVILVTALIIKWVSPGPAFYTQPRVGWRGETVGILKLRSMYMDSAERLEELLRTDPEARREWETYVKLSHDPRILPIIGNFIRRTSIDELPQLLNVVRGDISLVGPRPFPQYHVAKFSPQFQQMRCAVRPGLTGLWQVSDRSGADLNQQEAIDTFYIRNWSLWLDLFIVMRTIPAVLASRGAR